MSEPAGPPVLWTLVQVAHLARRTLSAVIAEDGISGPQFGVLAALLDGDDLSSSDLARALLVRPQSMAGLVDSLATKQMVEVTGPRGRGQRAVVNLTPEGRATAQRVRGHLHSLTGPVATGLDAVEERRLGRLLEQVRHHLEDGDAAGTTDDR